MINVPIMGHSNSNYNIKLDVFLKTEYIKVKKMRKNEDFIPSHKISLFHAQRQIKFYIYEKYTPKKGQAKVRKTSQSIKSPSPN